MARKRKEIKSPNKSPQQRRRLKKITHSKGNSKPQTPQKQKTKNSQKMELENLSQKETKPQYINENKEVEEILSDDDIIKKLEMDLQKQQKSTKKTKKQKSAKKKKQKEKSLFSNNSQKPFEGKKLVFTGLFNLTKERDDLIDLIKSLGGKVTSAVSGVTDSLIHGYQLEDGRDVSDSNKYKTAQKKGTLIFSEEDLSSKLKDFTGKSLQEHFGKFQFVENDNTEEYINSFKKKEEEDQKVIKQSGKKKANIRLEDILEIQQEEKMQQHKLWVDQYKPRNSKQILGNNSIVEKLKIWLSNWELSSNKSTKHRKENSKAVLISGPPGIGKTTAAKLISQESGYESIIKNASDLRNKKSIHNLLKVLENNYVLSNYFKKPNSLSKASIKKCVIIMDEVDGMKGDRGGMKELIQQIKDTHQPIICICNDRQSSVVKSLATYCYDLRFRAPKDSEIYKLLQMIVTNQLSEESWNLIDKSYLLNIIQTCQHDIRAIINHLQMWLKNYDFENPEFNGKRQKSTFKDIFSFHNPFEATKIILNSKLNKNTDYSQMKKCFFVDYNMMDMYIFENYIIRPHSFNKNALKNKKGNQRKSSSSSQIESNHFFQDDGDILQKVNLAVDSMIKGDQINRLIRKDGDYQLLNSFCFFSGIRPALLFARSVDFPQFPSFFMKISSRRKKQRLLTELKNSFSSINNILSMKATLQYCQTLSIVIKKLLINQRYEDLFQLSKVYGLNPDLIKENISSLMIFHSLNNQLDSIPTKYKTAFTKFYNRRMIIQRSKSTKSKNKKNKKSKKLIIKNEKSSNGEDNEEEQNIDEYDEKLEDFVVGDEFV